MALRQAGFPVPRQIAGTGCRCRVVRDDDVRRTSGHEKRCGCDGRSSLGVEAQRGAGQAVRDVEGNGRAGTTGSSGTIVTDDGGDFVLLQAEATSRLMGFEIERVHVLPFVIYSVGKC